MLTNEWLILVRVVRHRYITKGGSVCRFVCHAREPRLNGLTYRNAFKPHDRTMFLVS